MARDLFAPQNKESAQGRDLFQAQPEEPSFMDTMKDMFTGESRETRATRELPELESALVGGEASGFLSTMDPMDAAKVAGAIAITEDPNERASILKDASPDFGIQYDEKGNVIAANNKTGQRVVLNKPGLSASDLFPAFGQFAASLPAAGAGGAKAITAATGATTAGIEGLQELAGGEFNPENVVLDLVATGALEAVGPYIKAMRNKSAGKAERLTSEAIEAETGRIGDKLSPEMQSARQGEVVEQVAKQSQARKPQMRDIASDVAPEREIVEAAERLGVSEDLTPGQVSGSQIYRELEGAISAIPTSQLSLQQKEAISKVSQKADDLITEFGGQIDKSALSEQIKSDMLSTIDNLGKEAEATYGEITKAIPKGSRVNTDLLTKRIDEIASEMGGIENLEPLERKLLDIAKSNPTYAKLDLERKKIGQALRKATGPYKDAESGALKRMYSVLTDVQEQAANEAGAADLWNAAKSLVAQRKSLEEDSIGLLGKDLSGAIMPKLGQSMKKLSSGDYKQFDQIINALPKDQREKAVVSALNDVFSGSARSEQQLAVGGFVDWYEGLSRNKAAKSRIMKNLPKGAAQRMDDLYQVSRGIRNLGKERVRTGVINGLLDNFDKADGMLSKLYQTGRKVAAAEGATSVSGLPGVGTTAVLTESLLSGGKDPVRESADKLLSSAEFKNAIKAYGDKSVKSELKRKAADRALERSEKYQRWLELLPEDDKRAIMRSGLVTWLSGTDTQPEETQQ